MTELIVAIDESDAERALDIVKQTAEFVSWYKVGYEAYYGYGDRIVEALREANKSLFLDLKLHDIPNAVSAGVRAAASLGARIVTLHAAGGAAMLTAAAAARAECAPGALRLLAVTLLTSMSAQDLRETGIDRSPDELVLTRARLAARCGIDGVVCAVPEAAAVRAATGDGFVILCPGIRPTGADVGDQRRVAAPADAVRAGANYIVVGRPITRSTNPAAAAEAIAREMKGAS